MIRQIHFYALEQDLRTLLRTVESKGPLKYVRTGNFARDELKDGMAVFASGEQMPDLGKATADSSVACDSFLVCERDTRVNLRSQRASGGAERICVDQLINPDTVHFTPAGMWGELLLNGRIGTVSDSPASQALMRRFRSAARKNFRRVKAFYVGPKALELAQGGIRLTLSVQTPREFDLHVD